jgi:hypothetical protein
MDGFSGFNAVSFWKSVLGPKLRLSFLELRGSRGKIYLRPIVLDCPSEAKSKSMISRVNVDQKHK